MSLTPPERWLRVDGSTVSCTESVKVLNENWEDLVDELTSAYEDAVLMGCAKAEFKRHLHALVDSLECDYKELTAPASQPGRTDP